MSSGRRGSSPGRRERGKRQVGLSLGREAGEHLAQPASRDKRNLLTRSPCSRKELFRDLLPPPRAAAVSRTISGAAQEAPPQLCLGSWPCFWALPGQGTPVSAVLVPLHDCPGVDSGNLGPLQHTFPTPWKPSSRVAVGENRRLAFPSLAGTLSALGCNNPVALGNSLYHPGPGFLHL